MGFKFRPHRTPVVVAAAVTMLLASAPATLARQAEDELATVVAIAEAALEAISNEDMVAFTDLMIEGAVMYSVREAEGELAVDVRPRAAERDRQLGVDIVERGFDPTVQVDGTVASVWFPYDLYVDGAWSHCGVDIFTLVRTDGGWKIAALAWSVEQPPACEPHPEGPPAGASGPPTSAAAPGSGAAGQAEPMPEPDAADRAAARLPGMTPCDWPGATERVLCATFEVAENRAVADGRRIPLRVVVVPARAQSPPDEPVAFFSGGPGGAATARTASMIFARELRVRDILLIDQRGTGGSNPLHCDFGAGRPAAPGALPEMYPSEAVRACARELAERADLDLYTSEHHADDVEEIRRRLGYGRLHVHGGSYGTRAALVYAQRHPQSVATMFMLGTDSPLRSNLAERGQSAEAALAGVSAACAADPGCAALTPRLADSVASLLASFAGESRTFTLADPADSGHTMSLEIGGEWLAEQIRLLLYYGFTTRALPWAVHRAEAGDWEPLLQLAIVIDRFFESDLAEGVLLTVQCSEGMDFDVDAALAAGESTLFGSYRLAQQRQGCDAWPYAVRPPLGVEEPRPLPIPTLFLSGALDAVTPPRYADDAATLLPESLHVVLPEGQHGPYDLANGWHCVHRIWGELIAEESVDDLDISCTETMRRAPFLTDEEGFQRHLEESLVPLI